MKNRMIRGVVMAMCLTMLLPGAVCATEGGVNGGASAPAISIENVRNEAKETLNDYKLFLEPDENESKALDTIIKKAVDQIWEMKTSDMIDEYVTKIKKDMLNVTDPVEEKDDDEEEDKVVPVNADHYLMVGGSWVTPVAAAGREVSIVLPVVNMGKTMVTDAVVTPVLSTDTSVWPFEITNSNYSQTIKDLPGTDTGASDMDRRRELTWNLKTRSNVGNGYQKLSFDVRYRASDGTSQSTVLHTYVQLSGTAGVGADGQASVPR
ncbi:MAG: hypothetical protein IKV59_07590, partial [Lachnospiraceae bacterium]|nr:hypothetical protein [Lachnospiraceae bacterium]